MAEIARQPAYRTLADNLRERIEDGRIRPGQPLPSGAALMREYGVSSTVVKNAMRELRASGYAMGRQGKAVYAQLPTEPAWLTSLIAAGSKLAAFVDQNAIEGREGPLDDWQRAVDGVPSNVHRGSEHGV